MNKDRLTRLRDKHPVVISAAKNRLLTAAGRSNENYRVIFKYAFFFRNGNGML